MSVARRFLTMMSITRLLGFVARFAIVGLAVAFIVVVLRPELIRAPQATTAVPAPVSFAPTGTAVSTYADAVARSAPAVVNVYADRVVAERTLPPQLEGLFGDMWPGVRQRVERSLGSGVILDTDGHIVTNNHVVDDASVIKVQLADGREAQAKVMGRDTDTDLAVLQVDLKDLPTMPMGRSDTLRVGDVVLAIGNPVGLSQTVTQGIVSATGRGQLGVARFENFIQTDAAINLGNSGGALVNAAGELVGINTAIIARNAGIEGIGFAIPVNLVRGVMEEIFKNGRVIRGWLGVVPSDLTPQQARALGAPEGGVLVANLYVNSPALRAGLRPGDLITQIDNEKMQSAQEALSYVAKLSPGATVRIRGLRRGEKFDVSAQVVERGQPPPT
ncbi:MAG TPA: trypsin-like peptidase domain-containing protein [Steroidobacteraceae bacterium]|jgi:Do/DeqQ family serine protease|nr:trypsin-like peptidase domain-containing protein [Steroidobacteraceae bacterium]